MRRSLVFLMALLCSGCGTMPNGRRWGQDATLLPGWTRLKDSFVHAAVEPASWAPLAGALALQIGNADASISEWARDTTPVFGSNKNADNASDFLANTAQWSTYATALIAPSGAAPVDWVGDKGMGLGVDYLAGAASDQATIHLKDAFSRTRPDKSNNNSFPSAHASSAAAHANLSIDNIDTMQIPDAAKTVSHIALYTVEAGTAWARVEADKHYPSDVLAGLALGHFMAEFFDGAFLGLNDPDRPHVVVFTTGEGDALLGVTGTMN